MNTAWLQGLKGDEREAMKQYVLGNKKLLDILRKIMYNIGKELEETNLSDYETQSWSHKQAHRNGSLEMLRKLELICTTDE